MCLQKYLGRYSTLFVIVFFLLLYLLGANANSSLDAWAYAAQVSQGRDLFQPHHLLYNFLGYIWVSAISLIIPVDVLILLKILNAVAAVSILVVLSKLLNRINPDVTRNLWLTVFAGSSWAIMRFATENETYIIPIFFALLSMYYFVNVDKPKNYALSGLFAALSTLFHQVMFFWWLGLFIGTISRGRFKYLILFSIPALIVPVVYSLVVYLNFGSLSIGSLLHFVFSDYYSGVAGLDFGWKTILLLFINIIRSFVQVHGYILNLGYLFWVLGLVGFVLIGFALIRVIRNFRFIEIRESRLFWLVVAIIFFQIVFASISGGNAEFLVMIPILLAIALSLINNLSKLTIGLISLGVLTWNLTFGIIPLKYYRLDASEMVVNHIRSSEVKSVYILNNAPRIENELDYLRIDSKHTLIKSSSLSNPEVCDSIRTYALSGVDIYTNSYMLPSTISRERIVRDFDAEDRFFDQYKKVPIDSMSTISGKYYLVKVVYPNVLRPE